MFKNFININDLIALFSERDKIFSRLTSRLKISKTDRVKSAWAHTQSNYRYWNDIPQVIKRWNRIISGNPAIEHYEYLSEKYLFRSGLRAVSLGCGTGHRELRWTGLNKFASIDAYDLSESRIREANESALKAGYSDILKFISADIYGIDFPENHYDVVITEHSLHHFSPLEELMEKINKMLKPGGLFIFNEFTGPDRFQWTDRQLQAVNALLDILPGRYKRLPDGRRTKKIEARPGILRMLINDPSEAVESSRIMPLTEKIFKIEEVRYYGGTLLHLLFRDIAHNFMNDDPETIKWLQFCFEAEDALLSSREINSDFLLAVCSKKIV